MRWDGSGQSTTAATLWLFILALDDVIYEEISVRWKRYSSACMCRWLWSKCVNMLDLFNKGSRKLDLLQSSGMTESLNIEILFVTYHSQWIPKYTSLTSVLVPLTHSKKEKETLQSSNWSACGVTEICTKTAVFEVDYSASLSSFFESTIVCLVSFGILTKQFTVCKGLWVCFVQYLVLLRWQIVIQL